MQVVEDSRNELLHNVVLFFYTFFCAIYLMCATIVVNEIYKLEVRAVADEEVENCKQVLLGPLYFVQRHSNQIDCNRIED